MLHIPMPITLNFLMYTVGLWAILKWEWWIERFSFSNSGQKHISLRLRNNSLRLMTKVKKYKVPTHELMATLNLIKLSPNHRNEKTEKWILWWIHGTNGLNYLVPETNLIFSHSCKGDESLVVEVAAYSQVMTVAFEVVPFVHIHSVTLVRHNLLTKANANFCGEDLWVSSSLFLK